MKVSFTFHESGPIGEFFQRWLDLSKACQDLSKPDVVLDGENRVNSNATHLSIHDLTPGTKVLLINQLDPKLNGLRVVDWSIQAQPELS